MAVIPRTNILLNVTGQNIAVTGEWFTVPRDGREHLIASLNLSAGTCTAILEGRTGANGPTVQILTLNASDAQLVARFNQMRWRLSAATGADVKGILDVPCKQVV